METSPYMVAISDARALLLSESESFEGTTTLSLETCADLGYDSVLFWVHEFPALFIEYAHRLPSDYAELLFAYYFLRKTQTQLGKLCRDSQTHTGMILSRAIEALCFLIAFPDGISREQIEKILRDAKIETSLSVHGGGYFPRCENDVTVATADLLLPMSQRKTYREIAQANNLRKPPARRAIRDLMLRLIECPERAARMLGSWLFTCADHSANPGMHTLASRSKRRGNIEVSISDVCGQFRIRLEDPGCSDLFQPQSALGSR